MRRASSNGKMENIIFAIIGISDRAAEINNFFRQSDVFLEKGRNATAAIVQAVTVKTMKK
jgi:hypothetical protein